MNWSEAWAEMGIYGLGDWGSWASILGLAITVFVSWKLVQIVRAIAKDRLSIERIQNPIEIYHHIRQAGQFLEGLRSKGGIDKRVERELFRVLRGLQKSEDYLEHYFDFVSDLRQSGENAFLCAGRHFRSRGDAGRAALHYERALDYHRAYRRMRKEELEECVAELQICYLATFNIEGIHRLERRAKQTLKVSIEKVEPGISFRLQCLSEWLSMRLKAVVFPFRRQRSPDTKIIQIHKPSL
ncbi:MAG: hypothetical protein QOH06_2479 [Acidobacteriota bacterium]|nr:hypothetical protein [Acidobacteriota bacterium]